MTVHAGNVEIVEVEDRGNVKRPTVSVIMATYNQEGYLGAAVEGVLRQEVDFPYELLIGDDCSTDGTLELAQRLQRDHPQVVRVIPGSANVGLLKNYARLIRASAGEFVASCDGDDVWVDSKKLQHQVDLLRRQPDTGAVHTDFDHILWQHGRWQRLRDFQKHWYGREPVPQGRVFAQLLQRNFIQISTVCFRGSLLRACVEDGALADDYSVNDWPLCLHVAAHSAIAYMPESTTLYRKVSGSMTNSGYAARVRVFVGQIRIVEDACDRFLVAPADRTDALARLYRPMLSAAFFARAWTEFDRALAWLRSNDPNSARSWRIRLLPWLAKSSTARWILRRLQDSRVRRREATLYR